MEYVLKGFHESEIFLAPKTQMSPRADSLYFPTDPAASSTTANGTDFITSLAIPPIAPRSTDNAVMEFQPDVPIPCLQTSRIGPPMARAPNRRHDPGRMLPVDCLMITWMQWPLRRDPRTHPRPLLQVSLRN